MAFYPTEDYKVLTATTKEAIETATRAAIADGYELATDNTLYQNVYDTERAPYTQAVVKRTNTDDQYIAKLVAAFKPNFDAIQTQLTSMNTKLQQIVTNTNK